MEQQRGTLLTGDPGEVILPVTARPGDVALTLDGIEHEVREILLTPTCQYSADLLTEVIAMELATVMWSIGLIALFALLAVHLYRRRSLR